MRLIIATKSARRIIYGRRRVKKSLDLHFSSESLCISSHSRSVLRKIRRLLSDSKSFSEAPKWARVLVNSTIRSTSVLALRSSRNCATKAMRRRNASTSITFARWSTACRPLLALAFRSDSSLFSKTNQRTKRSFSHSCVLRIDIRASMLKSEFEKLVAEGFERLPQWVREKIKNVALLVEDEPSEEDRKAEGLADNETLLGLYKGIPLSARGQEYGVGMTMPDTITLYQRSIEEVALEDGKDIRDVVADTVWHEVAHHFGIDEGEVRHREDERGIGDFRMK